MMNVSFDHEWRGLEAQETDGYRYRDEEWGKKLFPGQCSLPARNFMSREPTPNAFQTWAASWR